MKLRLKKNPNVNEVKGCVKINVSLLMKTLIMSV